MPSSLKMSFYSNTYSITNLNNEISSNQNQQQIILGAKKIDISGNNLICPAR